VAGGQADGRTDDNRTIDAYSIAMLIQFLALFILQIYAYTQLGVGGLFRLEGREGNCPNIQSRIIVSWALRLES